ncbi:MAG: SRPBCC family protein [Chloroflexota bacterium]|nr:SRPBCC family protein [Chloroflexota bacterium]
MKLSRSVDVDRPVSAVWKWYAIDHVVNHPRWDPAMQLRQEGEGPIGVGTRIRRRHTRVDTPIEGTMEVVEFEPERSMGVVIRDGTPHGVLEVRGRAALEPLDAERTRLTFELELPGEAPSMDPSMIEASLRRIKQLIEDET